MGADHKGPLAAFVVIAIVAAVLLVTSVRSQADDSWVAVHRLISAQKSSVVAGSPTPAGVQQPPDAPATTPAGEGGEESSDTGSSQGVHGATDAASSTHGESRHSSRVTGRDSNGRHSGRRDHGAKDQGDAPDPNAGDDAPYDPASPLPSGLPDPFQHAFGSGPGEPFPSPGDDTGEQPGSTGFPAFRWPFAGFRLFPTPWARQHWLLPLQHRHR